MDVALQKKDFMGYEYRNITVKKANAGSLCGQLWEFWMDCGRNRGHRRKGGFRSYEVQA